jgi:TolB-like protein
LAIERVERRLTAILAADVAGYSRLMGGDEEGTLAQLKAHRRELVGPNIAEHRGRIVKTTGDGMLVEFASVVDALRCAVEVQRGMAKRSAAVPQEKRIEFRVGINVGDIILDGDDIYGDGVNVAARLEGLAEPGGICVSARVQEGARGKLEITFEDVGEQQLKNIERPVRVYTVRPSGGTRSRPALPLPDKPSIAVLPFENMSGDPEQEYFADGMVDEVITALSRFHNLFVIARNSSFTYKGRAVDVKQVGRELGVRYVLEGSVRKAANRIRIIGQLVDAATGAHLWADHFDGGLDDIFDLQDQVTASVVAAIDPKLLEAEMDRAKRKPTESLGAYDYVLRGLASAYQWTREATSEALRLSYEAMEIDPEYALAYSLAAGCYASRLANGWMSDTAREIAESTRVARRAIALGQDDAVALAWGGWALAFFVHEFDEGASAIDRALVLNPNLARAWSFSGAVKIYLGEPEVGIAHLAHAIRLNPLDQFLFGMGTALALGHFCAGRYEEAASWAEKSLGHRPNYPGALRVAAASNALAGRLETAQKTIRRLSEADPAFRVSNLRNFAPLRRAEDLARFEEGLRRAGLPE